MQETFQIGYARQMQYGSAKGRRHAVVPNPTRESDKDPEWVLRCSGKAGTREYKGFIGAITCRDCRSKIQEEGP